MCAVRKHMYNMPVPFNIQLSTYMQEEPIFLTPVRLVRTIFIASIILYVFGIWKHMYNLFPLTRCTCACGMETAC